MKHRYTAFWVKIPLLVLLWAAVAGAADPWWSPKWAYRREITIEDVKPSGIAGADVITVEIATGGVSKPDGSDIRVTTPRGKEVLSMVLMTGPGDKASLVFAKQSNLKKYYAYLGNPDAPEKRAALPIQRGVLLETRRCRAQPPIKLADAKKIFDRSPSVMGRRFIDRMFLGYNPFGPETAVANLMTGYLVAPKTGRYTFSCSSNDASFLLLDNELLISNGGRHRPQRDIRKRADVNLKAGLHKVAFYHVNQSHSPVLVLAWKKPDDKRVTVIPPAAFTLVHSAKPGPMQQRTKLLDIDFSPVYAGEAFGDNRYYQRYTFTATPVGRKVSGLKWFWDFGDGQTSTEPSVDHVYASDGMHTVTLTTQVGRTQLTRTNKIYVSRPWDRVTHRKIDEEAAYAAIVAAYNFKTLRAEAVAPAFDLLKRNKRTNDMIRACTQFLGRAKLSTESVNAIVPTVSKLMVENDRAADAARLLVIAAGKCQAPETAAQMTILAARITLDILQDDKEAMKLYTHASEYKGLTAATVRNAKIGLGDVWRARGDYDKALAAYKTAGFGPETRGKKHPILRGDFSRHIESYTLTATDHEFAQQYIDRWAGAFPADKLDGYLSLLTARFWMAQRRYSRVVNEANIVARVNPTGNYGAQLLMLAADAYQKMGNPSKASETLNRIVKNFPESSLAAEAAKMLKRK